MPLKTLAAKIKTKLIAPDFDFKQSTKLRACLEISDTDMVTALFSLQNELVYLLHYTYKSTDNLHDVFEHLVHTEAFFSQSYLNVYISISTPFYTLVPNLLFQNDNKEQWLKFNHAITNDNIVLNDDVYSADSKCIYAIDEKLKRIIDQTFPNNHVRHKTSCLAESLADISSKRYKSCLIHVNNNNFEVALYNKKITFFNTFEYQSTEDFLYFILASLEQNNFAIDETEIILSGEIEAQSALYDTLKDYFPKIKFAVTNKAILLKNDFEKLPNHFHYSLFNLYLCAL